MHRRQAHLNGRLSAAALFAAAFVTLVPTPHAASAGALPNGLFVERIGGTSSFGAGSGPANITTALPMFVDSFGLGSGTPAAPALTLSLPTTDNAVTKQWALTDVGNGDTGTEFTLDTMQQSPNGRYLTLAGFDDAAGAAVRTSGGVKTIGVIDVTTGSINTSVKFAGSSSPRSVTTVDTTRFWYMGSSQAERYVVPASDPATNSNTTQLSASGSLAQRTQSIYGGQLFLSGKSNVTGTIGTAPGIATLGVGIPNSTQTGLNQNYIITTGTNPAQFVMLDQDPGVGYTTAGSIATGLDVAYVGTDNGVEKYTYNGSAWVAAYSTAAGLSATNTSKLFGGINGLTFAGKDVDGNNILFGTTNGNNGKAAAGQGNALVRLVDTGAAATWSLVALSPDNTWFRGLQVAKPSSPGDANGDGALTPDDYALLDRGYSRYAAGDIPANAAGWRDGDFDYDGQITTADYLLADTAYAAAHPPSPDFLATRQAQFGDAYVSSLVASVPEPTTLSLLALALAIPLAVRRRRSR